MIVGHFFLAFTVIAIASLIKGFEEDEALKLAFLAGLFALIPDIDVLYGWKEIFTLFTADFYSFADSFWNASNEIHRGLTHTLFLLVTNTGLLTLYHRKPLKILAVSIILFNTFLGYITGSVMGGALSALVMAVFSASGVFIASRVPEVSNTKFAIISGTGLILHPLGDIFTGTPPDFLYPLQTNLIDSRIVIHSDPVLNLFAIFSLELFLVLTAIIAYARITCEDILDNLSPKILIGGLYFFVSPFVRNPTLSTSYQFVFSIIISGILISLIINWLDAQTGYFRIVLNFTSVISLCSIVFLISYLI